MKTPRIFYFLFILIFSFNSCEKDIDEIKPIIDISEANAFPASCDTLYFGESFELKVLFSDNAELGSFSIDIHHNFDHHSHSTEVSECSLKPIKDPVNPFTYIEDFNIPESSIEYETDISILIPSENGSGLYDDGDYHFFISLTDKEGWSAQKGLSIKVLNKK